MPAVTLISSQALQLTIMVEPFFTVTLGPHLLLAALLYDVALIALAVGAVRHLRSRRRRGSPAAPAHARLDAASPQVLAGMAITLPRI